MWSNTLNEINIIIQKLIDDTPIKCYRSEDGCDYLTDTNIVTSHYTNKNFNEIIERRSKRFINDIKMNNEIYILVKLIYII